MSTGQPADAAADDDDYDDEIEKMSEN